MKQIHCIYCNKSFEVRNNGRNRRYKNDLWMCNSCDTFQWIVQMQHKFYVDHCFLCDHWTEILNPFSTECACHHIWSSHINFKQGYDMLYCHYEIFTLNTTLANTNVPTSLNMMKLKFSSSASNGAVVNFNRDGAKLKEIIQIIKQIPAGKRSYDDTTNIWIIPATQLSVIDLLLSTQLNTRYNSTMIRHLDLNAFLNSPAPETKNAWSDIKVKAEKPEDFFYKPTNGVMPIADIQARFITIVSPFVPIPSLDDFSKFNKEWFMRAYKITARKLHPDLGGDPNKMSELNSLYMQYKEMVG